MEKRARFQSRWLPYALIAPQMAITLVFFFLPAGQAVYQSLMVQDAFGISTQFVWFDNFKDLFRNDEYLASFRVTAMFSFLVAVLGLSPFVTTLGMLSIVRGLAYVVSNGRGSFPGGPDADYFYALTSGDILGVPMPFIYLLILAAIMAVEARCTWYGDA